MTFSLKCEFCEKSSDLTAAQLKEVKQDDLILTIFTCSNCGKSRVVQIDNTETMELLSQYKHLYKKALKSQRYHKKVHTKVKINAQKIKRELDNKRNLLINQFSSLFTEYEDNKEQSELCEPTAINVGK